MKLIVITTPHFFEEEADIIADLFRAGLETLHLRKPGASPEELEELLQKLPVQYLTRIVTHEHFSLALTHSLKGVHLNARNPQLPAGFTGHVSRSCHSLGEVAKHKSTCHYVFLSPIYNSISKTDYASAYTFEALHEAYSAGIIDSKVLALGGISSKHFAEIASLGFGGVALLGDIWNRPLTEILPHFLELTCLNPPSSL